MKHEAVEKNIGLLAFFMVIAVSVGGLTQIVPLLFQDVTNKPVEGMKPRPALELGSILDLAADPVPETILALDEALASLRTTFPDEAEVVMLRFYAGLSVAETSAALQTSPRQVERHWQFARAWLYDAITRES